MEAAMKKTEKNIPAVIIALFLAGIFTGCSFLTDIDEMEPAPSAEPPVPTAPPVPEDSFNYETTRILTLSVNTGFAGVPVTFSKDETIHFQGVSDEEGWIRGSISIPDYYESMELSTVFLGLLSHGEVKISGDSLYFDYSSPEGLVEEEDGTENGETGGISYGAGGPDYQVLGAWNRSGKPDYLLSPDSISSGLLEMINQAIPELQPVPQYRPQYLEDSAQTDIHLVEEASVYVTFVHEGAGYRNALGFFRYTTADGPPSAVADSDITLIFPNVSYKGGGGELQSGDKVKIGTFPAGTSIGWVLIANGYNTYTRTVTSGLNTFYSVNVLNPDAPGHKQHTVLLNYEEESLFLLSFEDLKRPYGDNDFNDAVFYVTSDPVTAVDSSGVVQTTETGSASSDSDGDGISDTSDPEPFDSSVANYQYTPGVNSYGTLAYEDLWPHVGDYDFNDLVLNYRFRESLNGDSKIVAIRGEFVITGILASMHNGFAFELGLSPSDVASVSGGEYSRGYTFRDSNGTEQRQTKAVIIVFEDADLHYEADGPEQTVTIDIQLSRAVSRSELGYAPYNAFIMSNGERGREVHLPGQSQTDLAHYEYFGSEDDSSTLGTSDMYKTEDNRPWAIHLPVSFRYPFDDVPIFQAYYYYSLWVESDGSSYPDWYTDKPGYRNAAFLF